MNESRLSLGIISNGTNKNLPQWEGFCFLDVYKRIKAYLLVLGLVKKQPPYLVILGLDPRIQNFRKSAGFPPEFTLVNTGAGMTHRKVIFVRRLDSFACIRLNSVSGDDDEGSVIFITTEPTAVVGCEGLICPSFLLG
ncbi:MAG: hypothetical protein G01um101433_857 [Parcubacteria group bacterium Gr01-1014_33]|nr:MAG: hypothetical protein G01um101433_857 [Parcubacteria group bacterium Gr01-1014_33]